MNDVIGFSNVAYFDSESERDWFIDNVEGVPNVTMLKLPVITREDVPVYPLQLSFDEPDSPPAEVTPILNTPF